MYALKRTLVLLAVTLSVLSLEASGPGGPATPPVQALYEDAVAKEKAVRTALMPEQPPATVLKAVRTVVEEYESLVRAYPTSGYCDDALWYAGELSLDAFDKLGFARDKDAGVRLLRALASEYPTSKFARQVPQQLARAGGGVVGKAEPLARVDPPAPVRPLHGAPAAEGTRVSPAPVPATSIATIKEIRRTVLPDVVRIIIELDSEVTFHEERLNDPARVFIDLASTRAGPALLDQTIRFDGDTGVVRQVRLGRQSNNTTRVVLEAAGVSSFSVYPLYSPYRLVIDCVRPTKTVPARPATSPAPATTKPVGREGARPLAETRSDAAPAARAGTAASPPAIGANTPDVAPGGLSIARQLGLSVSRIVIDPGHGGHDPGAKGSGITEAELVLDVALRLETLLTKVPGVDVVLTRRTDEFVPLQERTAIANREHADLFFSIHANASTNEQARGVETYFLDIAKTFNEKTVAARENAENAASGRAMGDFPEFLKAIALDNKLDESRDLATIVQRALVNSLKGTNKTVKDLGVRQAPFVVLIGAAMPSVLSEISFVTNGPEAKLLRGSAYRQRIAEGLFNAIRKYQTSLATTQTATAARP